jgi:hypothetical protein
MRADAGATAMKVDYSITQKRFGNRLSFEFGPERLLYSWRDGDGERRFSVPYEMIDVASTTTTTINNSEFVQRLLLVPLVIWVVSMVLAKTNPLTAQILFDVAAVTGIPLLICKFFGLCAVKFEELPLVPSSNGTATDPPLRIIFDKNHDIVLSEINTRWRGRMKQLHGAVDFDNDTERELDKFRWLVKHDVIDDAEFCRISEQLRTYAAVRARPLPSQGTLN